MNSSSRTSELRTVIAELGAGAVQPVGQIDLLRPVRGATVWLPGIPVPDDLDLVLVCPWRDADDFASLARVLKAKPSRIVAVCADSDALAEALSKSAWKADVLHLRSMNAADVISGVDRSLLSADEAVSRRLGSLQRRLSMALADPSPITELLAQLKKVCSATAVLLDRNAQIIESTGPIPLVLVAKQIQSTKADTQIVDVDGWRGVATRLDDESTSDGHGGWLVVTARRPDFPDSYTAAAVHVGASLIEASNRMDNVARRQERAVRASVLEQALAMRRERHDAELGARIAGFGMTFDEELRVTVVRPLRAPAEDGRQAFFDSFHGALSRVLTTTGVPHLISVRADLAIVLSQCSVGAMQRMLVANADLLPSVHVGIGRDITAVGDVADSATDAQLAVRTLRRTGATHRVMSYEDFDFATRLFADVGLERMVSWAEVFLRPLEEKDRLIEALQCFFDYDQNINQAAEALHIHHNSLRYRLSKVEELLAINLRQPASISSVFLALTALELESPTSSRRSELRGPLITEDSRTDLGGATQFGPPVRDGLGVVYTPDDR